MLTVKNVKMLDGRIIQVEVSAEKDHLFDAEGKYTVIPALIDPHFHLSFEETAVDWNAVAKAALAGGITTFFCLVEEKIAGSLKDALSEENDKISKAIAKTGIPLHHHFYYFPDEQHVDGIGQAKQFLIGVGLNLKLDKAFEAFNDNIFRVAAQEDLIVVIDSDAQDKTKRAREVVRLTQKYNAQSYFLDISTAEELEIIRQARRSSLLIHTGTSTESLFGESRHQDALWRGIQDGTIDTIGSGHGPQHLEGLKNLLPQLLKAVKSKKMTLEKLIAMTRMNPVNMFRLKRNDDLLLVDMDKGELGYLIAEGKLLDAKKGV